MTDLLGRMGAILLLFLAIFCGRLSWIHAAHPPMEENLSILQGVVPITSETHDHMVLEEESSPSPASFTSWTQQNNQEIIVEGTGKNAKVSLLYFRGDSRLLIPGAPILESWDLSGCLLDRQTALSLTGDWEITGTSIQYGEKRYTVRGILDAPKAILILAAPHDQPLDNISLAGSSEDFVLRHSLQPSLVVQSKLYRNIAGFFRWLPLFTAGYLILGFLCHRYKQERLHPVRQLAAFLAILATISALLLLLLNVLPLELLPTQWSDFSFWPQLKEKATAYLAAYFCAPRYRPDILWLSWTVRCSWGMASALFTALCWFQWRASLSAIHR